MNSKPTLLGYVGAVTGATVSIRQSPSVASGIAIIGGKSYRIGQVGSFVRIPQEYHDLYGIVAEVGANATPEAVREPNDRGDRWMTIQLVGEIVGSSFERGISQYPSVNDEVHLVTEEDLAVIYGSADGGQIVIGRLANAEGISVRIDLDKLVTRHSAVLGSTGAGKSTTVASLLRSIVMGDAGDEQGGFPSASVLLLDVHGEYSRALQSIATVFRVNPSDGEEPLHIPFWALDPADLLTFLMGKLDDKAISQILDKVLEYKMTLANAVSFAGLDVTSMTADSPIPFNLKKLWFELVDPEIKTWEDSAKTKPALLEAGDAETLRAPKYKPNGLGSTAPFINNIGVLSIRRPLDQMRSRLLDRRYDFLLHPGAWEPKINGNTDKDLPDLLSTWLGHGKPITILDLSGIPSAVLAQLIAAILKIIYEGLFWGREKSEGGIHRPMLVVMEEAHRYLSKEGGGPARDIVQRIVKEGRKFGIGAMIVSQRPSEVDETILSQCGTFIALRLSNAADRSKVQGALPDNLSGIVESLPVLRTGEAIITSMPSSDTSKRFLNALSIRMSMSRAQGVGVDESALAKMLLFERCGDPKAYLELIKSVTESDDGKPAFLVDWEAKAIAGEAAQRKPPWAESFITEWLRLPPLLGGTDLRGALYVSREHAPLITPEDRLSAEAADLLEGLLEHPEMAGSINDRLVALPRPEISVIMDRLLGRARQEQEWGTPAILEACMAVAAADAPKGQRLSGFLKERPAAQIKASIVPKISDESWSKNVFDAWNEDEDIAKPVKNAINVYADRKLSHL